jgi:hypothetical protein
MPKTPATPLRFVDQWQKNVKGEIGDIIDATGVVIAIAGHEGRNEGNWIISNAEKQAAKQLVKAANQAPLLAAALLLAVNFINHGETHISEEHVIERAKQALQDTSEVVCACPSARTCACPEFDVATPAATEELCECGENPMQPCMCHG